MFLLLALLLLPGPPLVILGLLPVGSVAPLVEHLFLLDLPALGIGVRRGLDGGLVAFAGVLGGGGSTAWPEEGHLRVLIRVDHDVLQVPLVLTVIDLVEVVLDVQLVDAGTGAALVEA